MNTERQKQFVSCEVSRKLKEKLFNEPTMAFYDENGDFKFVPYNESDINLPNSVTKTENENKYSSAPLWQECFDWIMSKGIHFEQHHFGGDTYQFKICVDFGDRFWAGKQEMLHRKAKEKAILEALELIKIN